MKEGANLELLTVDMGARSAAKRHRDRGGHLYWAIEDFGGGG